MFDFKKYTKENLSTKEELELFRIFNGPNKKCFEGHQNHVVPADSKDHKSYERNLIVFTEKAKRYIERERME